MNPIVHVGSLLVEKQLDISLCLEKFQLTSLLSSFSVEFRFGISLLTNFPLKMSLSILFFKEIGGVFEVQIMFEVVLWRHRYQDYSL